MPATLAHTPLHDAHLRLHARLVPFAGWEMPVQYQQGIVAEHRAVRAAWGIFDVSHMGRIYLAGPRASRTLDYLVTADISGLQPGRARYGMLCTERGGILDDVVVLRLREDQFLLVCNAANRRAVLDWVRGHAPSEGLNVADRTEETAMVAAQGPAAAGKVDSLVQGRPSLLKRYAGAESEWDGEGVLVTRTGYTGEDGFELIVRAEVGLGLWEQLMGLGAAPCGLGARDTLRLEAGFPLHGQDIDSTTTPLEAGLERFVKLDDADFVGKAVLLDARRAGLTRKLAGFRAARGPVPRHGFPILHQGRQVGQVTSGCFAPALGITIGMGYVPPPLSEPGTRLLVDARGKSIEVAVDRLPFYRRRQP